MSLVSLVTMEGASIIFLLLGKYKNKKKSPVESQLSKGMIVILKSYNSTLT